MELTIESMRAGDDERHLALMRQAFGGTNAFDPGAPDMDPDKIVCAYRGDRMVGSMMTFDFAMTWGGRPVPCGGLSGVVVTPEVRGEGVARRMLAESFDRMDGRGQPISALYPTTASLYRSVGYEIVGWYRRRRIPVGAVSATGSDVTWREVDPDDPVVPALHHELAARHDGWFRVDPEWWAYRARRQQIDTTTNRYTYVGSRDGTDVVVVQYRYETAATFYDLEVEVLAGLDGEALGAGLGFLAGHGTTAGAITTAVPVALLAAHVPQLQQTTSASDWPWMLRIVDAPAAVQARGWPSCVSGRVDLDLADPERPANGGPHVLEIDAGSATLVRGGSGRITLSVQDLAMLYSGCDVHALRLAGRLAEASPDDLDLLSTACVSSPTIPFFF